jgi:hypothetical protein
MLATMMATVLIAGCANREKYPGKPDGVVALYLAAVARGDDERAYGLRCDADRRQQSLSAFKENTDRQVSSLDGWGDATIRQVKITGEAAEVSYSIVTGKGEQTGTGLLIREHGRWKVCNKN